MIARLTDSSFERTIANAQSPILVTFTAPIRCWVCREQKPALEALAYEGYPVYIVDVEQADAKYITQTFAGKGVPSHKMYAKGKLVQEMVDGKPNPVAFLGQLDAQGLLDLFARANKAVPARRGGYMSLGGMLGGFGRGELS